MFESNSSQQEFLFLFKFNKYNKETQKKKEKYMKWVLKVRLNLLSREFKLKNQTRVNVASTQFPFPRQVRERALHKLGKLPKLRPNR